MRMRARDLLPSPREQSEWWGGVGGGGRRCAQNHHHPPPRHAALARCMSTLPAAPRGEGKAREAAQ